MTNNDGEPVQDEVAQEAGELMQEAGESLEERREEQEEFLETVSEEEGHEVLETKCNLVGDYVVPLEAKLNGDVMDSLGSIQARIERLQDSEPEDTRVYDFGEAADEASQLLADIVADPEYSKDLFYQVYRDEGLEVLGELLNRAFESLKDERERRHGTASGFR